MFEILAYIGALVVLYYSEQFIVGLKKDGCFLSSKVSPFFKRIKSITSRFEDTDYYKQLNIYIREELKKTFRCYKINKRNTNNFYVMLVNNRTDNNVVNAYSYWILYCFTYRRILSDKKSDDAQYSVDKYCIEELLKLDKQIPNFITKYFNIDLEDLRKTKRMRYE
jgi:hypothetical protein